MKKFKIIGVIVLMVAIALIGTLLFMRWQFEQRNLSNAPTPVAQNTAQPEQLNASELVPGRYVEYSDERVDDAGFNDTILFFHAGWCPECRAFDETISESELPNGVQILKVDYDSATDLRQKYGVTLQSSFVSVQSNGDKIKYWQGYGKDKSVNVILENT